MNPSTSIELVDAAGQCSYFPIDMYRVTKKLLLGYLAWQGIRPVGSAVGTLEPSSDIRLKCKARKSPIQGCHPASPRFVAQLAGI